MKITVLNTIGELKSFPLTQTIKVSFEKAVEDSQLIDCISLIRLPSETGLFNISETYNQSIGYIREKFDIEEVKFTYQVEPDNSFTVFIKPVRPLSPGFEYLLFVDKKLSAEYLVLSKDISKSSSNISITSSNTDPVDLAIEIISEPYITSTSNITKLIVRDNITSITTPYTLNLKTNKTFKYKEITFKLNSDIYVAGEKFSLLSTGYVPLTNNYFVKIKASVTEDIEPIKTEESFKSVTNEDILNYYEQLNSNTTSNTNNENNVIVRVVGVGKLEVSLLNTDLTTAQLDFNNSEKTISEAFNMYTLTQLGLFEESKEYDITYSVKNDKVFIVEVKERG